MAQNPKSVRREQGVSRAWDKAANRMDGTRKKDNEFLAVSRKHKAAVERTNRDLKRGDR